MSMGQSPLAKPAGGNGTARICSCVALFFLVATLFSYNLLWSAWSNAMVYGSGPFVLSRTYFPSVTLSGVTFRNAHSYMSYGDLNDSLCYTDIELQVVNKTISQNNFETWSEYGFCDTANGSVRVPTEAVVIQTFSVLAVIFALFSTIFVCGCAGNKVGPLTTGAVAALGGIIALVVFSQSAAWNYYSDIRDGSGSVPVPYETTDGDITFMTFPVSGSVSLGPSFVALIFASLFLFYTSIVSFLQDRRGSLVLEQNYADNSDSQTGIEASGPIPKPTNGRVMDVDLSQV